MITVLTGAGLILLLCLLAWAVSRLLWWMRRGQRPLLATCLWAGAAAASGGAYVVLLIMALQTNDKTVGLLRLAAAVAFAVAGGWCAGRAHTAPARLAARAQQLLVVALRDHAIEPETFDEGRVYWQGTERALERLRDAGTVDPATAALFLADIRSVIQSGYTYNSPRIRPAAQPSPPPIQALRDMASRHRTRQVSRVPGPRKVD